MEHPKQGPQKRSPKNTKAKRKQETNYDNNALDKTQITFVGQIRSISTQPTNITYKLDDGTGLMEVKQWIDLDAANANPSEKMDVDGGGKAKLAEDGYARVWGRLKAFNNKRHVVAHIIRPVIDYNEINYHLLEATAVHLFFTRGALNTTNGGQQNSNTAANGNHANTGGVAGGQANDGTSLPHVTPLARRIFATLKTASHSNNEGLHVQMIASTMGVGLNEVYKGAEELVAAGVIFTTVDDNTFAVLDG